MGLQPLQRSMLPPRVVKCALTLNNVLKISESYGQSVRRSIRVDLNDITLDSAQAIGEDFIIVMHLTDKKSTLGSKEHFDQNKFKLGGVAKRELDARGIEFGEIHNEQLVVNTCRYLRLVVNNWKQRSPEEFSPKITTLFENPGDVWRCQRRYCED